MRARIYTGGPMTHTGARGAPYQHAKLDFMCDRMPSRGIHTQIAIELLAREPTRAHGKIFARTLRRGKPVRRFAAEIDTRVIRAWIHSWTRVYRYRKDPRSCEQTPDETVFDYPDGIILS